MKESEKRRRRTDEKNKVDFWLEQQVTIRIDGNVKLIRLVSN